MELAKPVSVPNSGVWLKDDGDWSAFDIHVGGGADAQSFHALGSTTTPVNLVPGFNWCEGILNLYSHSSAAPRGNATCARSCGIGLQNGTQSRGYSIKYTGTQGPNALLSSSINGSVHETFGYGFGRAGERSYDFLHLESLLQIPNGQAGSVVSFYNRVPFMSTTTSFYMPMLELGRPDTVLTQSQRTTSMLRSMSVANQIPSLSWGYTAGASYRGTGAIASLTLGGIDSSRFNASTTAAFVANGTDTAFVDLNSISVKLDNGDIRIYHVDDPFVGH